MNALFKLSARPKLNSPNLLAVWPGVGNVAMIVATYMQRKLGFKDLGEIIASRFFDTIGILVKDNVVEAPSFHRTSFTTGKTRAAVVM